jgi:hypothetical protein
MSQPHPALTRIAKAHADAKAAHNAAQAEYQRVVDAAREARDRKMQQATLALLALLDETLPGALDEAAEPVAQVTSIPAAAPAPPSLACPKCGAGVQWTCHGDTGTAHCERSARATSYPGTRIGSGDCDWSGSVRRVDGARVELVEEPAKAVEPAKAAEPAGELPPDPWPDAPPQPAVAPVKRATKKAAPAMAPTSTPHDGGLF